MRPIVAVAQTPARGGKVAQSLVREQSCKPHPDSAPRFFALWLLVLGRNPLLSPEVAALLQAGELGGLLGNGMLLADGPASSVRFTSLVPALRPLERSRCVCSSVISPVAFWSQDHDSVGAYTRDSDGEGRLNLFAVKSHFERCHSVCLEKLE